MHRYSMIVMGAMLLPVALPGCDQASTTVPIHRVSSHLCLSSEPSGAIEILEAKDIAKDGEPVVVVGRVGGGASPWIDGRAAFLLVDTRLSPSCESGDGCDACCPGCSQEMAAAGTMVKFLGEDGKVLQVDARELLGVKENETVVVRGVASRDPAGNVSIAANGIYIRR